MSTPSSPTSHRRRRSSHFSASASTKLQTPQHSRRSSSQTQPSPFQSSPSWHQASPTYDRSSRSRRSTTETPLPDSMLSPGDFPSPSNAGHTNGMDSLADELANMLDDDAAEYEDVNGEQLDGSRSSLVNGINGDSGYASNPSPTSPTSPTRAKPTRKPTPGRRKHSRTISAYEGSSYGEFSDSETSSLNDFPPSLNTLLTEIEALASATSLPSASNGNRPQSTTPTTTNFSRPFSPSNSRTSTQQSSNRNPSHSQNPQNHLPPLHPQSTLETLTTTLLSAEKSSSSHLRSETRALQNTSHFLFLPRSAHTIDSDTLDDILLSIDTCASALPSASLALPLQLAELSAAGEECRDALKELADALHMSLQVEGAVGRRLRACAEVVAGMRGEFERAERSRTWLEGVGGGKLGGGDRGNDGIGAGPVKGCKVADECKSIVDGFEGVCEGWRARLLEGAKGVGEAVA